MRIEYCEEKALAACLTYKTDHEEIADKHSGPTQYHGKYLAECKQYFDDCIEQNKLR